MQSGYDDSPFLQVIPGDCTLCYACIRECPVNAIEVKSNMTHVLISSDRCILCGACETICPTRAIRIRNQVGLTGDILKSEELCVALVDPSISAEFPDIHDYRNFVGMIRGLGFSKVYDLSFGVDLIAISYKRLLDDFKGKYWICSKCPAVVTAINKHYPNLTQNLAPVLTPYGVMARLIRQQAGPEAKLVLITPCLAARSDLPTLPENCRIDTLITFRDLRELFNLHDLNEKTFEYSDFDAPPGRNGSLFPLINGLMQTAGLTEDLIEGTVISSGGSQNMLDALNGFSEAGEFHRHLDLFLCDGCFMGPGMSENGHKFKKMTLVTDYARKRVNVIDAVTHQNQLDDASAVDTGRSFLSDPQPKPEVDEADIMDILTLLGKSTDEDNSRGCQSCGYRSCREFAVAVVSGFAKPEMCQHYSSRIHQDYIQNLRESNDQLARVQRALQESEKQAHDEKETVQEYAGTLQTLLQKIPSGLMVVNDQMKVVQANQVLIGILGEEAVSINEIIPGLKGADVRSLFPESVPGFFSYVLKNNQEILHKDVRINDRILNISVFPIKQGLIAGAVIRDLSSPEVQKEELFTRITEVIDNNLEMVQKIGFLLGEGAAETEQMLNSIISYFKANPEK